MARRRRRRRRKVRVTRREKEILETLKQKGGRIAGIERLLTDAYGRMSGRYLYVAWRRLYRLQEKGLVRIKPRTKKYGYIVELTQKGKKYIM